MFGGTRGSGLRREASFSIRSPTTTTTSTSTTNLPYTDREDANLIILSNYNLLLSTAKKK